MKIPARRWTAICVAAACLSLSWGSVGVSAPADTALPDSDRLAPVRASLQKTIDGAAKEGLPVELIVSKVREGLAKGVAPEAIRVAAERLAHSLAGADQFLKAHRKGPASPALLRTLAEAQSAGVDLATVGPLADSTASDAILGRAVEVLTDLALRGYPSRPAAVVVKEVTDRDARALSRMVAGVEQIRTEHTISRADALDALGRNIVVSGGSFDAALARTLEADDRAGNASPGGPGKSSQAPGHQGNVGAGKSKNPKK